MRINFNLLVGLVGVLLLPALRGTIGAPMLQPNNMETVLDCWRYGRLVDVVYREARGEPYEGKIAVAEVVLNRVQDENRWGDEINLVIDQPKQFSCFNEGDPNLSLHVTENEELLECCRAVSAALNGSNVSGRANHYLNLETVIRLTGGAPRWYRPEEVTAVIGRHTFLRK